MARKIITKRGKRYFESMTLADGPLLLLVYDIASASLVSPQSGRSFFLLRVPVGSSRVIVNFFDLKRVGRDKSSNLPDRMAKWSTEVTGKPTGTLADNRYHGIAITAALDLSLSFASVRLSVHGRLASVNCSGLNSEGRYCPPLPNQEKV